MPKRIFTCLSSLTFVAALAAAPLQTAQAQGGLCGKRDQVISQLKSVHGEIRMSVGLQQNARVMETYANVETGSWTIIVSSPTGVACLVAAGEAFQASAEDVAQKSLDDPA